MTSAMNNKKESKGEVVTNMDLGEPDSSTDSSNIAAAVERVASTMTSMSIRPIANKNDDGPSDCQVLIRTIGSSRDRWKSAAEKSGKTLSSWIRETLNEASDQLLDCQHPSEAQKNYPWARICTMCKMRFPK